MSTSFGWEGKDRYGSFRSQMYAGCAGKTDPLRTCAISEHLIGVHDEALYKSTFTFKDTTGYLDTQCRF